jgi:hypothetical protein
MQFGHFKIFQVLLFFKVTNLRLEGYSDHTNDVHL